MFNKDWPQKAQRQTQKSGRRIKRNVSGRFLPNEAREVAQLDQMSARTLVILSNEVEKKIDESADLELRVIIRAEDY